MSDSTREQQLIDECNRLRDLLRVMIDGAGATGVTLDFNIAKCADGSMSYRVIACAPAEHEMDMLKHAAVMLAEALREVGKMGPESAADTADLLDALSPNDITRTGSQAESES